MSIIGVSILTEKIGLFFENYFLYYKLLILKYKNKYIIVKSIITRFINCLYQKYFTICNVKLLFLLGLFFVLFEKNDYNNENTIIMCHRYMCSNKTKIIFVMPKTSVYMWTDEKKNNTWQLSYSTFFIQKVNHTWAMANSKMLPLCGP